MSELAFGVVRDAGRGLDELRESLSWVEFLDFSAEGAIEGARIQAELREDGTRIPIPDVVLAGVARNRGGTLVAADAHFDAVEGLSVEHHRSGCTAAVPPARIG